MKNNFVTNLTHKFQKKGDGTAETIIQTFKNFGIKMELMATHPGPMVSYFTFKLKTPVRMKDLDGFDRDLNYALGVSNVRIDAPVPDTSLIGIEVPNKERVFVDLDEMWKNIEFLRNKEKLLVPFGKTFDQKDVFLDLFELPHLLICGATKSGKTNFLHGLISSLLQKFSPEEIKFTLVDPKRVDFSAYNRLPHLLVEPICESRKVMNGLAWLNREMERRYELLMEAESLTIREYNRKVQDKLPYMVLIVDEYAVYLNENWFEERMVNILQMGRAVGLHVILSTARPDRKQLDNMMCANITARLCFRLSCIADSKAMLGTAGAETLIGYGDALFQDMNHAKPLRLQTPLVSQDKLRKNVQAIKDDYFGTTDNYADIYKVDDIFKLDDEDIDEELYEEAKAFVLNQGKASATLLQRKLKIGYAKASGLIDLLEEREVIGPAEGEKPRAVYGDDYGN